MLLCYCVKKEFRQYLQRQYKFRVIHKIFVHTMSSGLCLALDLLGIRSTSKTNSSILFFAAFLRVLVYKKNAYERKKSSFRPM